VGNVIGIGTFGEVRYGRSKSQHVALKIVNLARFPCETEALLKKEIAILNMLDHEHCAKLLEVHENVPYEGNPLNHCTAHTSNRLPLIAQHTNRIAFRRHLVQHVRVHGVRDRRKRLRVSPLQPLLQRALLQSDGSRARPCTGIGCRRR
jgi:serine/threonine protein kinase